MRTLIIACRRYVSHDQLVYRFPCSDGHPRIILSKALTSSYKVIPWSRIVVCTTSFYPLIQHIRLYATRHLGDLIRGSNVANAWTLRLLLTQLYDPAPEVWEMAVHFLEEMCESKDILQLVVEMRPSMGHLGEIGNPLLLKYAFTRIAGDKA